MHVVAASARRVCQLPNDAVTVSKSDTSCTLNLHLWQYQYAREKRHARRRRGSWCGHGPAWLRRVVTGVHGYDCSTTRPPRQKGWVSGAVIGACVELHHPNCCPNAHDYSDCRTYWVANAGANRPGQANAPTHGCMGGSSLAFECSTAGSPVRPGWVCQFVTSGFMV